MELRSLYASCPASLCSVLIFMAENSRQTLENRGAGEGIIKYVFGPHYRIRFRIGQWCRLWGWKNPIAGTYSIKKETAI